MKKILLVFAVGFSSFTGFAQQGKVVSAWNYIQSYNKGEGPDNLENAKVAIDEAIANEATMNQTKTWWYRSQVYQFIASDAILKPKYPDAALESIKSFAKMRALNEPKFKDWEDAIKNLQALSTVVFNDGVDAFRVNKYEVAYTNFGAISDINEIIEGKGQTSPIELKTSLGNAALAAENAGKFDAAAGFYKKLATKYPDPKFYHLLTVTYKKLKNVEEAKKTTDEALALFPTDKDILIDKINYFIADGKQTEAIAYLKKAIELDPKNEQLQAALGTSYDQLGDLENARKVYDNIILINPNSFEGNYGVGAMLFNKVKPLQDQMNALGYSKADQLKYEELKKQRNAVFMEAKPYLDKAAIAKPDNPEVKKALGNIETMLKN